MVTKLKCRWNLIDAVGLPKDKVISILLHLIGGLDTCTLYLDERIQ